MTNTRKILTLFALTSIFFTFLACGKSDHKKNNEQKTEVTEQESINDYSNIKSNEEKLAEVGFKFIKKEMKNEPGKMTYTWDRSFLDAFLNNQKNDKLTRLEMKSRLEEYILSMETYLEKYSGHFKVTEKNQQTSLMTLDESAKEEISQKILLAKNTVKKISHLD